MWTWQIWPGRRGSYCSWCPRPIPVRFLALQPKPPETKGLTLQRAARPRPVGSGTAIPTLRAPDSMCTVSAQIHLLRRLNGRPRSLFRYSTVASDLTGSFSSTVQKELPYPLLSDRKRILITALGAADGTRTKRSHFIFDKGTGKLLDKKLPVKPADRYVAVIVPFGFHRSDFLSNSSLRIVVPN